MRFSLIHRSVYEFDRPVSLGPHEIRLRPMPGALNTSHYSLSILPAAHTRYWYEDALGNCVARVVFPDAASQLELKVHLEADLQPLNPFSFLIESYAFNYPFHYAESLRRDLSAYMQKDVCGPLTQALIDEILDAQVQESVNMLVKLNRSIYERVAYQVRQEAGVQTPEQTLALQSGSCRDSTWLFIHIVRHLGLAARYISGYQIQLHEQSKQSAELHAWAEVYFPGGGWIGFDPTLGLLSAENYIPLAASTTVAGAAPVVGSHEACGVKAHFEIKIERLA